MTETPWADYLDERCQAQLGCSFQDAQILAPIALKSITREVLAQRWPHLREIYG